MNSITTPNMVQIEPTATPATLATLDALKTRFGENCSTTFVMREQHGRDESSFTVPPPDAVVFAESTQDVADAVRICAQHRTPVIPFGVGSSLEGHLLAVQGGVSLDVSRMNKVLAIHAEDLTVTVQTALRVKRSTKLSSTRGSSSPLTRVLMPPLAACARPEPVAPMLCAMARCAKMYWR